MDTAKARQILHAMSQGVDPATGEVLAPGHLLQRPEVIRTLHLAVREVDRAAWRERKKTEAAVNAGKPWFPVDDERLRQEFLSGLQTEELARLHGRTQAAIRERLVKLRCIPPPN